MEKLSASGLMQKYFLFKSKFEILKMFIVFDLPRWINDSHVLQAIFLECLFEPQ